jgi:hypothetical protein
MNPHQRNLGFRWFLIHIGVFSSSHLFFFFKEKKDTKTLLWACVRVFSQVLRHNHGLRRLDLRRNHPSAGRARGSSAANANAAAAHALADALLVRHEEALFGGGGSLPASVDRAKGVAQACAPLESLDGLSLRRVITRRRRPYPANQVEREVGAVPCQPGRTAIFFSFFLFLKKKTPTRPRDASPQTKGTRALVLAAVVARV